MIIAKSRTISSERTDRDIGRRLGVVRARNRQTQSQFADALGVSPRAYQTYERGESAVPISMLTSLFEIYAVQPLWMLTGIDSSQLPWEDEKLALVSDVVLKLEALLVESEYELSPERKAKLVVLLIQFSQNSKQVDEAKIADLLSLTA